MNTDPLPIATLLPSASRNVVSLWTRLFGSTSVPLTGTLPGWYTFPSGERRSCYMLSMRHVDPDRRESLAAYIAKRDKRSGWSVLQTLDSEDFPILASDVVVLMPQTAETTQTPKSKCTQGRDDDEFSACLCTGS